MEYLDPFFKRLNSAILDELTLEQQRDVILRENAELRGILQQVRVFE